MENVSGKNSHEENSALQGVRVIDLTHFMAGPACTQKLADLGADVIKVEPETGEFTRVWSIGDAFVQTESTSYHALNRNKRSIVLNAKDPDDYAALRKLITTADVFIQNFRPGVSDRLKLDYETLKASNPRLIYCAISGYGQSGPNRDRPGQDLLIQAFSGLPWNSGAADDPPVAAGSFIADSAAGNLAAIGILSALLARQRTGKGQKVEVSLLGALMDLQIQELTAFMNAGVEPKRQPERLAHPLLNGPYGLHRTADGWVAMSTTPLDVLAEALEVLVLSYFLEQLVELALRGLTLSLNKTRMHYVDVAMRRWEAFTGEQATLLADGRTFEAVAAERRSAAPATARIATSSAAATNQPGKI
jgi:crotonobetainyl-CoA:carnitine CoA-transferase CaiB-like acyl-CoA transferase